MKINNNTIMAATLLCAFYFCPVAYCLEPWQQEDQPGDKIDYYLDNILTSLDNITGMIRQYDPGSAYAGRDSREQSKGNLLSVPGVLKPAVKKEHSASFYESLAKSYAKGKKYSQAIRVYEYLLRRDPLNPTVNYRLGILYEYVYGDSQRSLFYLRRYLAQESRADNKRFAEFLIKIITANKCGQQGTL